MTFTGIIPARYGSRRFEGKPLCDLNGKPMIWHVYQSAREWPNFDEIYVATDDLKILKACNELKIPCITTNPDHVDCLDRAAEMVQILENTNRGTDKYIIIQGDEPLFNVETLNVDLTPSVINFYTESVEDRFDVNAVKVVINSMNIAMYFSRFSIPYSGNDTKREQVNITTYKQIGVYVFTGEKLKLFGSLSPSYLEKAEGIGLNRLLEKGVEICMRYTKYDSISVDTPSDREKILELMNEDQD